MTLLGRKIEPPRADARGVDPIVLFPPCYWQVHSPRRPTDHIQAAAFALATGS